MTLKATRQALNRYGETLAFAFALVYLPWLYFTDPKFHHKAQDTLVLLLYGIGVGVTAIVAWFVLSIAWWFVTRHKLWTAYVAVFFGSAALAGWFAAILGVAALAICAELRRFSDKL